LKGFQPANQSLDVRGGCARDHRAPAYRIHAIRTRSAPSFAKTFRNKSPDLVE
jgi:hypothetical protein